MGKQTNGKTKSVGPARARRRKTVVAVVCLLSIVAFFAIFAIPMGLSNAINTLMKTAFDLLINTVFYIMALAVIAGALSELMAAFGVVDLINRVLSPLMRPLFGMPGASALGIVTTYLSDNPAILTLASDAKFRRFFKAYQIPALTNLGTSFGMGLIVTSFMLAFSNMKTAGGGTLGSISNTRVPMKTVDIGLAQLAMHSAVETGGVKDTDYMVRACKAFYESALKITDDGAIVLE